MTFVLALMAIACAPFPAWGSSFNTFPPALKGLKDIAVSWALFHGHYIVTKGPSP